MFMKKNTLRVDPGWIDGWTEKLQYTPDAIQLCRRLHHRVFIPDQMMSNINKDRIGVGLHSAKINLGFITQDKFNYIKQVEGEHVLGIPLADETVAPIRGELYAMRPEQIITIDKHKQNGVQFNRERIQLRIPYHIQKKDWDKTVQLAELKVSAWMYIGNLDYWGSILNKGIKIKSKVSGISRICGNAVFSSIKTFIPHNPLLEEYYYFTPLEYDTTKFRPIPSTVPGVWKFGRAS